MDDTKRRGRPGFDGPRIGPAAEAVDNVATVARERQAIYGPPSEDFGRTAALKALVAPCPDPALRHALEMILVKVGRLVKTPGHVDSWVDIAGYARAGAAIIDDQAFAARVATERLEELYEEE